MPILKRESDVFPADLFDLPGERFPWWVAHTKTRQEKALARVLEPRGVPFYLPQREHRKRRAGRNFVSYLPLFPGYLFFRGSDSERLAALKSNLILRLLPVPEQSLLQEELAQLRVLQQSGASLVPFTPIHPGDPVRIAEGPFEGYTGIVLREKRGPRLVVCVSMLRKSVIVELPREVLAAKSRSG